MKEYVVTVSCKEGSISYNCFYKTERGAFGYGKRLANEAFYGEECKIEVELEVDFLKRQEKNKSFSQKIEEQEIRIRKENFRALTSEEQEISIRKENFRALTSQFYG